MELNRVCGYSSLVCWGNVFGLLQWGLRDEGGNQRLVTTVVSLAGICRLCQAPNQLRPCAWQQRGFQIIPSPQVKNPKPYHFVNVYLTASQAGVSDVEWNSEMCAHTHAVLPQSTESQSYSQVQFV